MNKNKLCILLLASLFATSNIYINNTNHINVQNSNDLTVDINLSIGSLSFEEVSLNNNVYTQINIEQSYQSTKNFGAPNLPTFNSLIEIPRNSDIEIEINISSHSPSFIISNSITEV